jgi:hypothetical protein
MSLFFQGAKPSLIALLAHKLLLKAKRLQEWGSEVCNFKCYVLRRELHSFIYIPKALQALKYYQRLPRLPPQLRWNEEMMFT